MNKSYWLQLLAGALSCSTALQAEDVSRLEGVTVIGTIATKGIKVPKLPILYKQKVRRWL